MRAAKAYLAGTGASSALLAAVCVSFLILAGVLSVNGFPDGSFGSDGDTVFVGPATSGAPEAAAAAAASAAGSVAAAPVGDAGGAGPGGAGGGADGGAPVGGGGGGAGTPGAVPPAPAPGAPGAPAPTPTPPSPSAPSGPLSNTVSGLEGTAEGATGTDLPLSETTKPVTDQLDKTITDVTGLLGN